MVPFISPDIKEYVHIRIEKENEKSEQLISVVQFFFLLLYLALFLIAPKPVDNTSNIQPVLLVILIGLPFVIIRIYLSFKTKLHSVLITVFIFFDMALLSLLIYSFHLQYMQPPAFYLKAPTFIYFFIFIGLRALRYDLRFFITSGLCAAFFWALLVFLACLNSKSVITHSYTDYMFKPVILLGAEIEKILALIFFTIIVSLALWKHRVNYFTTLADVRVKELELLKAQEQKVKFMIMASHELRTPMNGLLGNLELLLETSSTQELKETYSDMYRSVINLIDITNKVIDFHEIKNIKLINKNHDINELCNSICHKIKNKFNKGLITQQYDSHNNKKKIDLIFKTDANLNIRRLLDEKKYEQIICYIFENALKFTQQGTIHLSFKIDKTQKQEFLYTEICDSGIGIAAEHINHLFKPFSQADDSLTRKFGGTGIGSAICYELVTKMGGTINIENRADGYTGVLCKISLPLEKSKDDSYQEKSKKLLDKSLTKILIVEDNIVNQKLMKALLMSLGFKNLTVCENGKEGFEVYQNLKPDIVMMDIQMPVMDGLECTNKIRKYEQIENVDACLIFAVTAHANGNYFEDIKSNGFDNIDVKPVSKKSLLDMISQHAQWKT